MLGWKGRDLLEKEYHKSCKSTEYGRDANRNVVLDGYMIMFWKKGTITVGKVLYKCWKSESIWT